MAVGTHTLTRQFTGPESKDLATATLASLHDVERKVCPKARSSVYSHQGWLRIIWSAVTEFTVRMRISHITHQQHAGQ